MAHGLQDEDVNRIHTYLVVFPSQGLTSKTRPAVKASSASTAPPTHSNKIANMIAMIIPGSIAMAVLEYVASLQLRASKGPTPKDS
jgi:hypothetical protein